MIYKKEIDEEIKSVESLKILTEVYGEIASIRMIKIRNFVLKNREFLQTINEIFQDSLKAYASKLTELVRRGKLKKGGRVTFLAHNGKTVAVLISANTGFYGEVIQATFEKFLDDVRQGNVEATIIGRMGRSLFLESEPKTPYTYFDFPDYGIDHVKLSEAIRHLVSYEEIRVYFGRYQSIIKQTPSKFSISAGTPISKEVEEPKVKYIFEPSVEKILMFFETEIFASLFDQSIRESQLAKFASRILAMNVASENIRTRLDSLSLEKLKLFHRLVERKQLNSLSSIMFSK